jgi:DNA polymerase-3 subunit gamma/tau
MSGSYQVIARKWRPQTFDDVVGQDHVVRTLKNAITRNRIAHAYLFVGPRGTGKTSTARIFAKALNATGGPKADFDVNDPICVSIADGSCLDVIEIDGASNNGIEQVRELRDTVRYAPAQGQYKVYIIDEVHMLSNQAFNALLKTLEEPPPHVKFIFATTDVQKVLPTIISRCQRFDLKPIPSELIVQRLKKIAAAEKIKVTDAALASIARMADGGMRDAQSIFDQMISFCGNEVGEADVLDVYGLVAGEKITALAAALAAADHKKIV